MQMFDNQLPVQPVFRFPPGTVMWGDAAGWPSWKKGGRATNESSWSMLDGIVVAGTDASAASMSRRTACGNTRPVFLYVVDGTRATLGDPAMQELAEVWWGVCLPPCKGDHSKPMSYLEPGRRLALPSEWGDSASINPMTPIDSCMWQPRRSRTPRPRGRRLLRAYATATSPHDLSPLWHALRAAAETMATLIRHLPFQTASCLPRCLSFYIPLEFQRT